MDQLFIKYQKVINKLPLEARIIIFTIILSFIFVIWYYGFWYSLHLDTIKTTNSIKITKAAIPLLKIQLEATEKFIKDKREQEKKASREKNSKSQLIPSQRMNEVLQDLLTNRYRLILLELKNLQPKVVAVPQTDFSLFEHGIVIKFQGDYFSTMNYLQTIENLGWRIFWDKLEYKVIQYPRAEITLQIHTINDQGDWIDI